MAKYDHPEKEQARITLLKAAIENLKARGLAAGDISALVLVDGTDPQARDAEVLEGLGVARSRVTVVSKEWTEDVKTLYAGCTLVESELSRSIEAASTPFHIVYLDFCKPLPNESAEHQVSTLFKIFQHRRLAQRSVLITNFAVKGYFDVQLYREFMRAYVAPDYWSEGGVSRMSIRTLSSGVNRLGGDLFAPKEKIREGDVTMEQKAKILTAFMDNFVSDIAEVYVPASSVGFGAPADLLAELDEFVESNVDPTTCPPELQEMMKKGSCLMGQLAQCARLLEKAPEGIATLLRPFTQTKEELLALAVQTEFRGKGWRLRQVYHPHLLGSSPYPSTAYNMLPLVWSVDLIDEVMSWELWGDDALRRRQGLAPSPLRLLPVSGPVLCGCGLRGPSGAERVDA